MKVGTSGNPAHAWQTRARSGDCCSVCANANMEHLRQVATKVVRQPPTELTLAEGYLCIHMRF